MWFVFGLFWMFLSGGEGSIELEVPEERDWSFLADRQIAADGSILIATLDELWHWDENGQLINVIRSDGGRNGFEAIAAVHYFPRQKRYWIIDGRHRTSLFFDEHLKRIGEGFQEDDWGQRQPVYFRHIIPVGSRLFVMDGSKLSAWYAKRPKVLHQVRCEVAEQGVKISLPGKPFATISETQRAYFYDFKRHWIVQAGFSKVLYVVDELSTHIRPFSPGKTDIEDGLVRSDKEIPLPMRHRVAPPPPEAKQKLDTRESMLEWWHSFSRLQGFFAYGDQLILGYSTPNPKNPQSSLLVLQLMNRDGLAIGDAIVGDGDLLGVHKDKVYVLKRPEFNRKGPLTVSYLRRGKP